MWFLFFDRLEFARRINGDVPTALLLPDRFVVFFQAVDSESHRDVQIRAFFQNPGDIRNDSFPNLAVGCDVERSKLVVGPERSRDLRQIRARERLATRENQDAQVATQRFRDPFNIPRRHLQLLARTVVELIGEETMGAAHITHRSHQDVQQNWRKRLSQSKLSPAFKGVAHWEIVLMNTYMFLRLRKECQK